jgi:hypothetical protein
MHCKSLVGRLSRSTPACAHLDPVRLDAIAMLVPAFHAIWPMVSTPAPAIVPPQARNPARTTRSPPIAALEAPGALQRLARLRECARGWDGHQLHSGSGEDSHGVGRMHTPIPGHQTRRSAKHLVMMAHRLHGLPMLVGLLQDPLSPLCRGMARVCGSNRLRTLSAEATFFPSSMRERVWAMTRLTSGTTCSASLVWLLRRRSRCNA